MTAINNLPNYNGHYQLSKQGGGAAQSVGGSVLRTSASASASLSGGSDAYLLDLSPEARQYLAGLGSGKPASGPAAGNANFRLSAEQQQAIDEILARYKDAPFTQETFEQIQDDLAAAGLSPDRLAALENAKDYNTTMVLIEALNETPAEDSITGGVSDEEKQGRIDTFLQQVVSQWKSISTSDESSAGSAEGGESGVTAVGSAGGA